MENERLKSQFKYANGGKGITIPDFSGQVFNKEELMVKYMEHLKKYKKLRKEHKEATGKIDNMRITMEEWKQVFRKHDIEFTEDADLS